MKKEGEPLNWASQGIRFSTFILVRFRNFFLVRFQYLINGDLEHEPQQRQSNKTNLRKHIADLACLSIKSYFNICEKTANGPVRGSQPSTFISKQLTGKVNLSFWLQMHQYLLTVTFRAQTRVLHEITVVVQSNFLDSGPNTAIIE